jgi:hypothetical protein
MKTVAAKVFVFELSGGANKIAAENRVGITLICQTQV